MRYAVFRHLLRVLFTRQRQDHRHSDELLKVSCKNRSRWISNIVNRRARAISWQFSLLSIRNNLLCWRIDLLQLTSYNVFEEFYRVCEFVGCLVFPLFGERLEGSRLKVYSYAGEFDLLSFYLQAPHSWIESKNTSWNLQNDAKDRTNWPGLPLGVIIDQFLRLKNSNTGKYSWINRDLVKGQIKSHEILNYKTEKK